MANFWDLLFMAEKTSWGLEPADSALHAAALFKKEGHKRILIPGVGYGRNSSSFLGEGFDVTGIEISKVAINLARELGFKFPIHHGSVTNMPFDNSVYNGIFCYSLLHLLNKPERKQFLKHCFSQLADNGHMYFTVISTESEMYGIGKCLSKGRYQIKPGLKVFFYDHIDIQKEFTKFGLVDYYPFDEPVKHVVDATYMKCYRVVCKKYPAT